jgi:hypothetical protein
MHALPLSGRVAGDWSGWSGGKGWREGGNGTGGSRGGLRSAYAPVRAVAVAVTTVVLVRVGP